MKPPRCEFPVQHCKHAAIWLVSVGTRKTDAQLSCDRHLRPTCQAMVNGEGRRRVLLTVAYVAELAWEGADVRSALVA